MAVPDTTTFTLQNVVNEINPSTDDLVKSFSDAVASKFDSSYEGSKNQLLNFRNYGAVSLTPFFSGAGQSDNKFLCIQAIDRTRYHDGSGTFPITGDTVYNNSSGSTTTGSSKYSAGTSIGGTPGALYIIGGSNGIVTQHGVCSPP